MHPTKTCVLQIGNSDNKLTQQEWANFIISVNLELSAKRWPVHFAGGSSPENPWQNYCWIFETSSLDDFETNLTYIRKQYRQDSVALLVGDTKFI